MTARDIGDLDGNASAGKTLYDASCAGCHGADGKGGTFDVNIVLSRRIRRDVVIADKIIDGVEEMPSFAQWSDQEIADVIAYVNDL